MALKVSPGVNNRWSDSFGDADPSAGGRQTFYLFSVEGRIAYALRYALIACTQTVHLKYLSQATA
jgi:hypothetical protein